MTEAQIARPMPATPIIGYPPTLSSGSGMDQFADSLRQPVIRDGLMEPLAEQPGFGPLANSEWARAQIVDDPDGNLKMEWRTSEE